jgi:hypothetical protein
MKNLSNLILISIIFTIFASNLYAAGANKSQSYQMPQKTTGAKTVQTPQEKRQQFEQEAADATPDIEAENAKVLSWVNSNQTPDDANRNTALKNVAKNRKYVSILNKQQKGFEYYTLSAWVYYFDDKPDKALKQAVAGQKLAPQNSNIAKTCLALSLIYKDYAAASEVFANKGELSQAAESAPSSTKKFSLNSQSSNTELNFDVNSIRPELLGKVFDVRPQTTSPTEKNILCVLLWKIDSNELDRFTVAETKGPNEPNSPPPAAAQSPAGNETLKSAAGTQLEAFSKLQSHFAKESKIVFMGINLNDPAKTNNVKNWLAKTPQPWETSMPSAQLQQKITSLFTAVPARPTLIIAGPDSTVRYTGDVNSFLPQMIIRYISGNPQEFQEPNKPNDANRPPAASKSPVVVVPVKVTPLPQEPNKPHQAPAVREANEIPKPSQAAQAAVPAKTAIAPADKQQQNDDSFDPRAEQLLETAKGFFKIGDRLQYHTYAKPIEMCRTVINDYPNTKYAEQARTLMRQVPERFRARYNITDQELGL